MLLRAHASRQFHAPEPEDFGRGRRGRKRAAETAAAAASTASTPLGGYGEVDSAAGGVSAAGASDRDDFAEQDYSPPPVAVRAGPLPPIAAVCARVSRCVCAQAPKRLKIIPPRRPDGASPAAASDYGGGGGGGGGRKREREERGGGGGGYERGPPLDWPHTDDSDGGGSGDGDGDERELDEDDDVSSDDVLPPPRARAAHAAPDADAPDDAADGDGDGEGGGDEGLLGADAEAAAALAATAQQLEADFIDVGGMDDEFALAGLMAPGDADDADGAPPL
jgi:hypothetical protein